jgi:hypothetical protein
VRHSHERHNVTSRTQVNLDSFRVGAMTSKRFWRDFRSANVGFLGHNPNIKPRPGQNAKGNRGFKKRASTGGAAAPESTSATRGHHAVALPDNE